MQRTSLLWPSRRKLFRQQRSLSRGPLAIVAAIGTAMIILSLVLPPT